MSIAAGFDEFWARYPRKVGKLAAQKAYMKARQTNGATQAELLAGIDAYVKHKPAYADFAHPASWLNAGRWMDQWDVPPERRVAVPKSDWWEECKRLHALQCNGQYGHWVQMQIDAERKSWKSST